MGKMAVSFLPGDLTEQADNDLVRLAQERGGRDDRPFQELMHRYQQVVWRVCYSFTRNPQDAEDLTQEVFFKAYRSLEGFEGRSSFKTWVYRIAINTSQNEIRRRSRRPQEADKAVDDMAEYLPSSVSVEAEWQKRHQNELLAQAIASLRPEEVEVLHLKDLEQRPYAEIAEMLDISVSAAKMRVQRARLALQAAYRLLTPVGEEDLPRRHGGHRVVIFIFISVITVSRWFKT